MSEAFLASLLWFIARRGLPNTIYSNNGTNFDGAKSELFKLQNLVKTNTQKITSELLNEEKSINWEFLLVKAPHFGGLWEIHVKLIKNHLKKAIGERIPTFRGILNAFSTSRGSYKFTPFITPQL